MKSIIYIIFIILLFGGCTKEPIVECLTECRVPTVKQNITLQVSDENITFPIADENMSEIQKANARILFDELPKTYLLKSSFEDLPNWENENYILALNSFINSCRSLNTQALYKNLCQKAKEANDPKAFLLGEFDPYKINTQDGKEEGLLTGYYEPHLHGSLTKSQKFQYPIYKTPNDLIEVDLSSIYPSLKNYRLRGRLEGNRVIPYYSREELKSKNVSADVICYVDSKIDLFFLEIQGSGRILLENNKTLYVGYANQNGHRYRAIGRYLVKIRALGLAEVSLQSIRKWLEENPSRVDEVLNYNKSVVYFNQKNDPASGSLGLELTPKRSVAVDRNYIPLGSMLYLDASLSNHSISNIVLAEDTGGAIKGAIRADIFLGFGNEAMNMAGELKAPLKLWILLPKDKKEQNI